MHRSNIFLLTLSHSDDNNLSGDSITESIAVLEAMEEFSVFRNNLSGPLPPVLGSLTNLKLVDLEENEFDGPVVIGEYVALVNLEEYRVGRNKLSGSLPGAIENWTKLIVLSIGDNVVTGPVPPEIGTLTALGKSLTLLTREMHYHGPTENLTSPPFFLCRTLLHAKQSNEWTSSGRNGQSYESPRVSCSV